MVTETKLERALQNTALNFINQDIRDILEVLNQITIEIPKEVEKQLVILKNDIKILEDSLKKIPENFDLNFSNKMDSILESISEIKEINNSVNESIFSNLDEMIDRYFAEKNAKIDKLINSNLMISRSNLILYIFISCVFGCVFGGLTIFSIIFYLA